MAGRDTLLFFLDKQRLNLEDIIRHANNCSKIIDSIKNEISSSDDFTENEFNVILEHFDLYKSSMVDLKKFFVLYESALCATLNHLKPSKIKWIPEEKSNLKMKFKGGNSPWLIYLTYIDEIDVSSYLNESFANGALKPLSKVSKLDFICCKENDQFYRAVVLDIGHDARLKTLYFVDTGITSVVNHMNVYEIPDTCFDLPAQCMQCIFNNSLTDQDRLSWPPEMGEIFQYVLSNLELIVSIVAEKDSFPPVYLVDIVASEEHPTSLNEWLSNRLLPELERLEPGYNTGEFLARLQTDRIFDPFYSEPECSPSKLPLISRIAEDLVGQPIPIATSSSVNVQPRQHKPVMRSELRNFSTQPEVGTVMVVRILRIITMNSAYILMPIKFSMFSRDKRTWSQLNEDLNFASTVECYEDFSETPMENELVIVKSSGGLFRRAKVIRIMSNSLIEVFYIDHGYFESVKPTDIKLMLEKFMNIPAQAVKTTFDFTTTYKAICETSVILVMVLKYEKVGDEIELTVKVCI